MCDTPWENANKVLVQAHPPNEFLVQCDPANEKLVEPPEGGHLYMPGKLATAAT